jgi:glyceraldehyde-3-phosphate dehydrogenase/erythrose-4-phosphate dehydrogenase
MSRIAISGLGRMGKPVLRAFTNVERPTRSYF